MDINNERTIKLLNSSDIGDVVIGVTLLEKKSLEEIKEFFQSNFLKLTYLNGFEGVIEAFASRSFSQVKSVIIFKKEDVFVFRDVSIFGFCKKGCFYTKISDVLWI